MNTTATTRAGHPRRVTARNPAAAMHRHGPRHGAAWGHMHPPVMS